MPYTMRRNNRMLDEKSALRILQDGEYGILSTCGEDGYPYGVPVNYVFSEGRIFFHCAANAGHKLANLRFCDKVCFTVVGSHSVDEAGFTDRYESVICFGTARLLADDTQKRSALLALVEKYSPNHREQGLKLIESALSRTDICEIAITAMSSKGNRKDATD